MALAKRIDLPDDFNKFLCPIRMAVVGPSMSGKSTFILKMVKDRGTLFTHSFTRIIYCLPHNDISTSREYLDDLRKACPKLEVHEGLPTVASLDLEHNTKHVLLILEDLAISLANNTEALNWFFRHSHHKCVSIVYTIQALYLQSKHGSTFMGSCTDFVIFKMPNVQSLNRFSRSFYPSEGELFSEALDFLNTKYPNDRPYIVLNKNPQQQLPQRACLRGRIFKDESPGPIYFSPSV